MKKIMVLVLGGILLSGCVKAEVEPVEPERVLLLPGSFDITIEELDQRIADLPPNIQQHIRGNPEAFLVYLGDVLDMAPETFVLADKNNHLPKDYEPEDLVSLNGFSLRRNRNDLRLRRLIMPDVMAMDMAAKNDGLALVYSSTYRSFDYQAGLYERNVRQMGQEAADRESARPGASQHQLGTTIDFGSITDAFAFTPEGLWLFEHAWEYGFSLSYPDGYEELTGYRYESWHYRWLGRAGARMARDFFDDVQHYFLYFLHDHRDWFEARRL